MSYLPDDAVGRARRSQHPSQAQVPPATADGPSQHPSPEQPSLATRAAHQRAHYYPDQAAPHRSGIGLLIGMTTLGTLLPGSGLLLSGRRRSGATLLGVFVLLVAAGAGFVYWQGPTAAALYVAVRPRWLLSLAVGLSLFVLIWCISVVHTAWVNRPKGPSAGARLLSVAWVGLLCAALVVPTVGAAQYVLIQNDLLQSMFDPATRRSTTTPPNVSQVDPWENLPRANVLLIGSDQYPGREGIRTDSLMLVSTDTKTGNTVLFGIPRNLEGYTFRPTNPLHKYYPDGPHCGLECMINAVWQMAATRSAEFVGDPNPGLTTLTEVVSDLVGQTIDSTVVIDIRGFSALVDAMGGVDITVRSRLPIGGKRGESGQIVPGSILGWIEPGPQHMDGYTAMWFARSRVLADDFDRMRRQRCMVGALARQVNPLTMLRRYPALAKVAKDNIQIDIPMAQLPAWADLVTRVQKGTIRSLPFTSSIINVTRPDYPKIHRLVEDALDPAAGTPTPTPTQRPTRSPTPPPSATAPPDGLVDVDDAC